MNLTWHIQANLFVFASFFGVTALSADRFLAIHLHLRCKELVTYKRVVDLVVSVCTFTERHLLHFCNYYSSLFDNCSLSQLQNTHGRSTPCASNPSSSGTASGTKWRSGECWKIGRVRKSAVATIFIYLVFLVCYLPNTCRVWITAITSPNPLLNTVIRYGTLTLLLLNSFLNPLIYCWRMRHIRQAVIEILRNTFSRQN